MTVNISKPAINVREKLNELDKPTGIAGEAMLRAETPQEQFNLIGAGRRNLIINGAMEIYQRNTAFSGSSGYSLDRWKLQQDAGADTTCSQVDVSSGTAPYAKGHRKALQIAVTNTSTASNFYAQAAYYMEGLDASKMGINASGGNHITLSFWVKNSVGGQYYAFVDDAKSGFRYSFGYTVEANVWEYVTVTIPPKDGMVIDNDNSIEFRIVFPAYYAADFTAADAVLNQWHSHNGAKFTPDFPTQWSNVSGATLQITGVQLELGKVATPFEHRSYGEELALCQRFFERISSEGNGRSLFAVGYNESISTARWILNYEKKAFCTDDK
mgnify:CR=1 FL=1